MNSTYTKLKDCLKINMTVICKYVIHKIAPYHLMLHCFVVGMVYPVLVFFKSSVRIQKN